METETGTWKSTKKNMEEIPRKHEVALIDVDFNKVETEMAKHFITKTRERINEAFYIHFDFGSDKPCYVTSSRNEPWTLQIKMKMREVMSKDVPAIGENATFSKLPRRLEQLSERGSIKRN